MLTKKQFYGTYRKPFLQFISLSSSSFSGNGYVVRKRRAHQPLADLARNTCVYQHNCCKSGLPASEIHTMNALTLHLRWHRWNRHWSRLFVKSAVTFEVKNQSYKYTCWFRANVVKHLKPKNFLIGQWKSIQYTWVNVKNFEIKFLSYYSWIHFWSSEYVQRDVVM